MKKNLFKSAFIAFISLAFVANVFTSCNGDDPVDPVTADKTALNTLIAECDALLASETLTTDYPEASIATFRSVVNTAKVVAQNATATQQNVDNAVNSLNAARRAFLASAYGAIPESALLIGLSFDEGEGTELVAEGKNLKAVLQPGPAEIFGANSNLPSFIDGKKGKAMYFSNGAHLAIDNYNANDFLGQELSIAVWVNPDSTRAGNYIISHNYWNSWKFNLQEQNKPFFTVKTDLGHVDADNQADLSAPNRAWTHLVVTMNLRTSILEFYVNGQSTMRWDLEGKPNLTGNVTPYEKALPILIGCATTYAEASTWDWAWDRVPAAWDSFIGSMDELKVYNIALESGQVQKLYRDENN